MSEFRFTGNPFADAGLAGMCAAAGVSAPEDLSNEHIQSAMTRLVRIMTSPQALEPMPKRADPKTVKAFATSELSAVFPNGPHSNPKIRKDKKAGEYQKQISALVEALHQPAENGEYCFSCGRPAGRRATKTDFPLVDSAGRRNFHPGLTAGHPICAHCALAVQFLPLSLLRTNPGGGYFWFISSLDPRIAVTASAELTLRHMESCLASGSRLELYGEWIASGRCNAVVQCMHYLAVHGFRRGIVDPLYPVRAIFFSNDNRGVEISVLDVPSTLFSFFSSPKIGSNSTGRFMREVLHIKKFGESIASLMLNEQHIASRCIVIPDNEQETPRLRGSWEAHREYMKVVMKMSDRYIRTVEDIAGRIAASEDPVKVFKEMKLERHHFRWFHKGISCGWLTRKELYSLVSPNDYRAALRALDYIRAATADAIRRKTDGEQLSEWKVEDDQCAAEQHPIIQLVEQVGCRVCDSGGNGYDPKRLRNYLLKARNQSDIRGAWLRVLEQNAIGWHEFKQLVPIDAKGDIYIIRDYMLAYLTDRLRGDIEIDEPSLELEMPEQSDITYEEEEPWPTLS